MAKLLVSATISALLVTVLFVIASCAQNITVPRNGTRTTRNAATTQKPNTTRAQNITVPRNGTRTTRNAATTQKPNTARRTSDDRQFPTISIPPLTKVGSKPMMTVAAIAGGAVIIVFVVCYISSMMNLCICKFLMHECPSGRYKDDEPKKKKEGKKKKGDNEDLSPDKSKSEEKQIPEEKPDKKKKKPDEEAPEASTEKEKPAPPEEKSKKKKKGKSDDELA